MPQNQTEAGFVLEMHYRFADGVEVKSFRSEDGSKICAIVYVNGEPIPERYDELQHALNKAKLLINKQESVKPIEE